MPGRECPARNMWLTTLSNEVLSNSLTSIEVALGQAEAASCKFLQVYTLRMLVECDPL
jgi:hypothetical protein